MKSRLNRAPLAALALAAGVALSQGQEVTLNVGDPAPKLQTGRWMQGEPVTAFEKDKVYIVEFWATWCGPCIVSIPHLNELHLKFKDKGLVVIGQDVWERDETKVAPFIKEMGGKMTYRVALDDKEGSERGKMSDTWMQAAGRNGIPSAFLVNQEARIAWIGHPMQLKESLIEEVLSGKFDINKAASAYAEQIKNSKLMEGLWGKLREAKTRKDWPGAEKAIAEIEKAAPSQGRLDFERLQVNLAAGDFAVSRELANDLRRSEHKNATMLNEVAWAIAIARGADGETLKLAEEIAIHAVESSSGKDANILDTLARLQFLNGAKEKAILTQQKAIDAAPAQARKRFQEVLASYKAGELPPGN